MIQYPHIDPIIFSIGPVAVRWYGLMYVIGFGTAWWLGRRRAAQSAALWPGSTWQSVDVDDLVFFEAMGAVLGGRIGWILFYGLGDVMTEPSRIFRIWEGGMSFHGGMLGVLVASWWFAKSRGRNLLDVWDFTAPLPALGLCAGRIGNFINGELWGKVTDVPWAVVYKGEARHPSQLYEALLEGLLLFAILWIYNSKARPRGAASGLFCVGYGVFRFSVEFVRIPDINRGYLLFGWVTEGQLLSLPMIVGGIAMMLWAYRRSPSVKYSAIKSSD
jgi:phosphatidylglycerol---prolipoprotein diacylglyceryl transferase